jgi:hypothetical protein
LTCGSHSLESPYKRVMEALHGGAPKPTPFTIYDSHLPSCSAERELRNRGLGLVRRISSYTVRQPNVKVTTVSYTDDRGRWVTRTIYSTPHGELTMLDEPAGYTSWRHEHLFKSPDDFRALLFLIQDSRAEANYGPAARAVAELGEDFVVRDQLPAEPLQSLISGHMMNPEDFCVQWMDNRDEILKLYEAQLEFNRSVYPLVADGPLEFANYGGNVTPQIIGVDTFRNYYVPNYNEAAEVLHKKGKLVGSHLDADNSLIMSAVAQSNLDYIEAYDAGISPSVKVAREAWPGKVLWIHWPSAWQMFPEPEVKARTIQLVEEAAPGNGFIIGITEDIPEDRWQGNLLAIMDGIEEFAGSL